RLKTELYAAPALVPASPWLSTRKPAAPRGITSPDAATGECVLRVTGIRTASWWTARVYVNGAWQTHVLPSAQNSLVIAPSCSDGLRVHVTAVDRFGTESEVTSSTAGPARRAVRG